MASVQVHPASDVMANQAKRYYVSEATSITKYVLPADDEERERLNLQGRMINRLFDDKPIWAPIEFKAGDVILDSGSGSGQWALSASEVVPEGVQIRGMDIESRMFPPTHPSNTTFMLGSITSLPADWTSSVTLIHQRLLLAGLQEHQWKTALKEMYRTLVPGGWVQLFEPDYMLNTPVDAVRDHVSFQLRDRLCMDVRKVRLDITRHLPTWLEEAGFVVHKVECRGLPLGSWAGEFGRLSGQATWDFFEAIKVPVLKEGGFGLVSSEEEYDAVMEEIARLFEETPDTYFNYHVHVAQKPLNA